MRFGICRGLEDMEAAARAGFDYVEPPVREIAPAVGEGDMEALVRRAADSPIKPEAFNCFIPGDLKVTGPDASIDALREYVESVLPRAAALGAEVIVFGSGGARGVPEGFPEEAAWRQIEAFLHAINPAAASSGIEIAVEPLRAGECNIINRVSEAHALAARLELSHVKALADLYHMGQESEPLDSIAAAGDCLRHVHIAHPVTRQCPLPDDGYDYAPFFRELAGAGYDARVSFECGWDNFDEQAPRSLEYIRSVQSLAC